MPSLKTNIAALYGVQLANYLVPLLTLPCLTRALGASGFGRYSFCLGFVTYFVLLVDYGFNFSATQEIARHREDHVRCSAIFCSTTTVRVLLAALGVALLVLATMLNDRLRADRELLLFGYLTVFGGALTPNWYFQGTEDMALPSALSAAFRLASVPVLYWFVHSPADIVSAIQISAAPSVLSGITCLGILAWRNSVQITLPSRSDLLATLLSGWHLFLSTAAISLYTTTNVILLGFVAGDAAVGYFSGAERLARAATTFMTPIGQAFYPRISRLVEESQDRAFELIRRLLRLQAALSLAVSLLLAATAPLSVRLLYGAHFAPTVDALLWMAPLPLLITLSNVLGVQTMLPLGLQRNVSRILLLTGAVNVALLYPLASIFAANGAAIAVTISEALVTVLMACALWARRAPIFPHWIPGNAR